MFTYEVQVILTEEGKAKIESETENEKVPHSSRNEWIGTATEHFRGEDKSKIIFVSAIRSPRLTLCVLSNESVSISYPKKFLASLEIEFSHIKMQEIRLFQARRFLGLAERQLYVIDANALLSHLGLNDSNDCFYNGPLISPLSKREILRQSKSLLSESFQAEINRILATGRKSDFCGHPVHYIIETSEEEFFEKAFDLLCSALYYAGRVKSRQCCIRRNGSDPSRHLYHLYGYGIICADFGFVPRRGEIEEEYADDHQRRLIEYAQEMLINRNRVLTVFHFPKDCEKLKKWLFDEAPDCTFVEIKEENIDVNRARTYLTQLAEENHVPPNEQLYAGIPEGESQLTIKQLNSIFWLWHDGYLKSTVYPQYAEFQNAQKQKALQKPEGDAYAKLQKMVGLESAKNVIEEAINFYKAQKLFQSYGIAEDHPSMHMVFTGNPGTAKTTVARLFAKIMRDNGILSEGRLYEVGRADLVGRYVGWTAKIVKEMFRKAKGSVLFIDEAYSLVDDRSGLYGDEAINTIVQEMENSREDMIVIFAGYPKEMEQFLRKNPGLSSRIAFHIPFEDYSPEELYQIAELTAESKGVCLAQPVKEKLLPVFQSVSGQEDFGNGRYVRNLIERARIRQSVRLMSSNTNTATKEEIATLLPEDFEMPKPPADRSQKIGFI